MTINGFNLTLASLIKPSDIPSEDAIVSAGKNILNLTASWKPGKTYHKIVKTCSSAKGPGDVAGWYCRVSEHPPEEAQFNQMWEKLGKDNAINQKKFIPEVKTVTKIKEISPTASIWSFTYKLPPPMSPRVYTVLQVVRLEEETTPRSGFIISIPIDLSSPEDTELAKLEGKGIRGLYVVVERLMELGNGSTEWRMATTGVAGGSIPSFLVEWSMASKVSQDVPNFMRWLQSLPR